MAEKYSNTGTTTTIGNEVAKLLRITKKAKENVNKTISNWTSEKTGIFKTDVKDQQLLTTPEVEDKSNKNQQDVAHLLSNQKTTAQQFDRISQKTSLLQNDIKLLQEESSKMKSSSEIKKYAIFYNTLDEKLKTTVVSNVMKSEESELLTKNFDSCAISSESLSNLCATSHSKSVNEIIRQNVSKKSNKGTKELVDKYTSITNQYIYLSKTTSQIPAILETPRHLNEQKRTRTSAGNFSSHETKYRHDRASQIPATLETRNHLNEQKGTRTSADNFTTRGTKIRHHRATTTYSRRHEQDSYRKTLIMQTLISLEQLRESLVNVKYPLYIWPSGRPLILSNLRQKELDFSSNEYLERLHSFVNGINRRHRTWNSDQIVRPDPMVLAGFSYDGEDDKVVCKSCGAISDVNDWSDDDEDYAFSKHREAVNGPCEFLRTFDGGAQSTQAEKSLGVNTEQCNPK